MKKYFFPILLILNLVSSLSFCALEWVEPDNKQTSYLFAPGIHSSERQVAKYCESYISSTGQAVQTSNDFTVIGSLVHGINFSEIVLDQRDFRGLQSKDFIKPKNLLGQLYNKIVIWRNRSNDKAEKITVEKKDNKGSDVAAPSVTLHSINLGQQEDIETLSDAYDKHQKELSDTEVVLYGVSRGAATVFNFMASDYQIKEIKNVKVVILEGCFDSMGHLLYCKYPKMLTTAKKLFSFIYPGHDLNGIQPIELVDQFPKDIPVLLITSKKDSVVPCKTTWNLYYELKDAGHPHVYILELDHSSHPRYMMDNENDKIAYQAVVHAFYAKFNLAHNCQYAQWGQELLDTCQP